MPVTCTLLEYITNNRLHFQPREFVPKQQSAVFIVFIESFPQKCKLNADSLTTLINLVPAFTKFAPVVHADQHMCASKRLEPADEWCSVLYTTQYYIVVHLHTLARWIDDYFLCRCLVGKQRCFVK